LNYETAALGLHQNLLGTITDASVYLKKFAHSLIGQEELHGLELKKMLWDFSQN
jgi:bacterioferritin